ncbi:MAG: UDP-N-acetylmuramoyl-L-alanyl-D-glutamate--2,6-diaminopimelate ligase [Deltaproteobacteria bacterium]|nr:UDP-N-acetylmuramoyl-L-alanyl-D-glutamate--2,6-diaminopimelate ligase [Deltaproteobacteria bacterium]
MKISALAALLNCPCWTPDGRDPEILGVSEDSRDILPGWLFAAVYGAKDSGGRYARDALERGAAGLIVPSDFNALQKLHIPAATLAEAPRIALPEPFRKSLGEASRQIYGEPEKGLLLVGITGSNGKSTISYLVETLFTDLGYYPGVLGTVNYRWPGERLVGANTTPEGPLLFRTLARMREDGARSAIMEVSSHALSLGRLGKTLFSLALFSNLSRDHLDFHGDLENYFRAKETLFTDYLAPPEALSPHVPPGEPRALVNADDPYGQRLLLSLGPLARGYGLAAGEIRGKIVGLSRAGIDLEVVTKRGAYRIQSSLLGRFNASNLLAAASVGESLRAPQGLVAGSLSASGGAPGRLSRVGTEERFLALVDYAHSPEALLSAVEAVRELTTGKVVVVFGCGGDRDRGKRPLMGQAAARAAIAVLTTDNPRSEDPMAIIAEAEEGLQEAGLRRAASLREAVAGTYLVAPDRGEAIQWGAALLESGDALLVAGKGHENYQIFRDGRVYFDDAETTLKALREQGKSE